MIPSKHDVQYGDNFRLFPLVSSHHPSPDSSLELTWIHHSLIFFLVPPINRILTPNLMAADHHLLRTSQKYVGASVFRSDGTSLPLKSGANSQMVRTEVPCGILLYRRPMYWIWRHSILHPPLILFTSNERLCHVRK